VTSETAQLRFTELLLPYLDHAYSLVRWLAGGGVTDAEDIVQHAGPR